MSLKKNTAMRSILRQTLVLLALAAIPALVSAYVHRALFATPPPAADETSWEQVAAWQRAASTTPVGSPTSNPAAAPRILLIDARPLENHLAAHAPGALPLNEAHWEQQLPAIIEALGAAPETRIVVYCDDALCDASRAVATRLRRELGHTDIFVLKGGWRAR